MNDALTCDNGDDEQGFFVHLAESVLTEYEGDDYTDFDENSICMFIAIKASREFDDSMEICNSDIVARARQSFYPKKVKEIWNEKRARADMFANCGFYKSMGHDEIDIVQTLANCFPWLLGDICAIFSRLPEAWELRIEILFIIGQLMFGYLYKIENIINSPSVRDNITKTASYRTTGMYFKLLDAICARASKGKKTIPDLLKENLNAHGYLNVKLVLRSKMLHRHLRNKIICPLREKKYRHLACPTIDYLTNDCDLRRIFSAVHCWQNFANFLKTTYNLGNDTFSCYTNCSDPSDYLLVLFATHENASLVGESKSSTMIRESANYTTRNDPSHWQTAEKRFDDTQSTFNHISFALEKLPITQSHMYAFLNDSTQQIVIASVLLRGLTTLNNTIGIVIRELNGKQKDILVNLIPSDALSMATSVNNIAVGFGICKDSFTKILAHNDILRESLMRLIQNWIDLKQSNGAHIKPIEDYIHLHRLMHWSMSLSNLNKAAETIDRQIGASVPPVELK
uniref:U24-like protein n=1 Tax=Glypta fumiferanae TaxID=389681 RepID=A0A0F6Q8T7_9HYME|nr:U24-like protein [Glypta fumiferanae]